jgi:hypothetical protein
MAHMQLPVLLAQVVTAARELFIIITAKTVAVAAQEQSAAQAELVEMVVPEVQAAPVEYHFRLILFLVRLSFLIIKMLS